MAHVPLSLTDAVKASAGRPPPASARAPRPRPETSLTQSVKKVASRRRSPPATRTGRKGIVIYFDPHVAASIRRLALDWNVTNQQLGEWAFKYLFEKLGEAWPA